MCCFADDGKLYQSNDGAGANDGECGEMLCILSVVYRGKHFLRTAMIFRTRTIESQNKHLCDGYFSVFAS